MSHDLFFACNAGLLASVIARRSAGAGVLTAVIMVAYFGWPFLWDSLVGMVAYATGSWNHLPEVPKHLAAAFAAPVALQEVLDSRVARPDIAAILGILIGGGLTAFLFARFLFARFCSEEFATATHEVAPTKGKNSRGGRRDFDPGRAWDDAVFWRDFHFLHGGKKGVVLKAPATHSLRALPSQLGAVIGPQARQTPAPQTPEPSHAVPSGALTFLSVQVAPVGPPQVMPPR